MTDSRHNTQRLAELIGQKRQVLAQLQQVAVRQGELVEVGDSTTLLRLLAAKQNLLGGLQKVERALTPFHEQDPESRVWPSPEARAACAAEAGECSRLLEEVVALEKQHEQRMTEQRDHVAQQLRVAHAAHQAAGAYGQQARRVAGPATLAEPENAAPPVGIDLTSGS